MEEIFDGIFKHNEMIFTKNLLVGHRVYGEKLFTFNEAEYRQWNPYRSKYCAGIMKGLQQSIFKKNSKCLYLGSAEGTTVSHVSDIVGEKGEVFCVDISETAMLKLATLSEKRENILPFIGDANNPSAYEEFFEEKADTMFQDVSQRNQADIFCRNAYLLKKGAIAALSLKTQSVSQRKSKNEILLDEKKILEKEFDILQVLSIEPFEKEHYLILVKKK
jgi:fibrillarin-like pre-rRNA processing protein